MIRHIDTDELFAGTAHLALHKLERFGLEGLWGPDDFAEHGLYWTPDPEPEPLPEPEPVVPSAITPLQARKALREAGLKDAVDAFIDGLDEEEQEEWEYAIEVRRDNPIIAKGAAALSLSESDVDGLFILGATL